MCCVGCSWLWCVGIGALCCVSVGHCHYVPVLSFFSIGSLTWCDIVGVCLLVAAAAGADNMPNNITAASHRSAYRTASRFHHLSFRPPRPASSHRCSLSAVSQPLFLLPAAILSSHSHHCLLFPSLIAPAAVAARLTIRLSWLASPTSLLSCTRLPSHPYYSATQQPLPSLVAATSSQP